MARKFFHYRMSLLINAQPNLFDSAQLAPSREQYLRRVFAERFEFSSGTALYHFVPIPRLDERYISGWIGRKLVVSEHSPPDRGFDEVRRDSWQASLVVIDPFEHSDGQKLAIENDSRVGTPNRILHHLFFYLNARKQDKFYDVEIEPIFNKNDFWEFAARHRGRIRSLTFEFVAQTCLASADQSMQRYVISKKGSKHQRSRFAFQAARR
jgi:hypothetical protein